MGNDRVYVLFSYGYSCRNDNLYHQERRGEMKLWMWIVLAVIAFVVVFILEVRQNKIRDISRDDFGEDED